MPDMRDYLLKNNTSPKNKENQNDIFFFTRVRLRLLSLLFVGVLKQIENVSTSLIKYPVSTRRSIVRDL